ncbi:hypothetical protein [Metabacillus niabensis]
MATICYYEDHNIILKPNRSANGYRVYTSDYIAKNL